MPKSRPFGVTVMGILNFIGGILMVIMGMGIVIAAVLIPVIPSAQGESASGFAETLGIGMGVMGAITIALGIASFVSAFGLLKRKEWAWTTTVIVSTINIALAVFTIASGNWLAVISILISGWIIYYLFKPHVKSYFRRGVKTGVSMAA